MRHFWSTGVIVLALAGPAIAEDAAGPPDVEAAGEDPTGWSAEFSVGLVSDYRFRGVSMSDEQAAAQAGVTVSHANGFHGDLFVSTIDEWGVGPDGDGAQVEVDFTLGWSFSTGGLDFDVAAAAWTYPDGTDASYVEFPVSVSRTSGEVTVSVGLEYAPAQRALGDRDNTYAWLGAEWTRGTSPWSVAGWVGFEDGAWAPDGKTDWALGVTRGFGVMSVGVTYIDSDRDWGPPALVGEVKATF
jgi:uncharacterized protein (TIGR02001 family)